MKNKLTYIISDSFTRTRIVAYEWYAEFMQKEGYEVTFIILGGNPYLKEYLKEKGIIYYNLNYQGKNKLEILFNICKACIYLLRIRPHIVHTHYLDANLLGLPAAYICRVKKRVYTRHHGTMHHRENENKLIKRDKRFQSLFYFLSTDIIAPSQSVYDIINNERNGDIKKLHLVYHGFNMDYFLNPNLNKINLLKDKYKLSGKGPYIGTVASYDKLKGIQYVISAFAKIRAHFPNAHIILANASGSDQKFIKQKISILPPESYTEILFEPDSVSLFKLLDVFVHVPIQKNVEAFGQVYIEAMIMGIPTVITAAGIAADFAQDRINTLLVAFSNSEQIYNSILCILNDQNLKNQITTKAKSDVLKQFDIMIMIKKYCVIYGN